MRDKNNDMALKHSISIPLLIHIFALAHAMTAIFSRLLHWEDDVLLTILTISLIVIISIRHRLQAEIVATLSLCGCFLGYLLGNYGAQTVSIFIPNPTWSAAITTLLITEVTGWATYAFVKIKGTKVEKKVQWDSSTKVIIVFALGILLLRIAYSFFFTTPIFNDTSFTERFQIITQNTLVITVLICCNIIFLGLAVRMAHRFRFNKGIIILHLLSLSGLAALLVYFDFPIKSIPDGTTNRFLQPFVLTLFLNIVIYSASRIIQFVISSRRELKSERGKKHLAQFQYNRLKLQINPHFLFNSLNILDFLVQEQQTERASSFIRKLANIYRYMLQNEENEVVPLREEIAFTKQYIDLLRERFSEGFIVEWKLTDEEANYHVIPCCLQLLVENATKHNIVNRESPLVVHISIEEGAYLVVSNNLQPRISGQNSTKKGLKYIRHQYLDISGKDILIDKTTNQFIVKLPLL